MLPTTTSTFNVPYTRPHNSCAQSRGMPLSVAEGSVQCLADRRHQGWQGGRSRCPGTRVRRLGGRFRPDSGEEEGPGGVGVQRPGPKAPSRLGGGFVGRRMLPRFGLAQLGADRLVVCLPARLESRRLDSDSVRLGADDGSGSSAPLGTARARLGSRLSLASRLRPSSSSSSSIPSTNQQPTSSQLCGSLLEQRPVAAPRVSAPVA